METIQNGNKQLNGLQQMRKLQCYELMFQLAMKNTP